MLTKQVHRHHFVTPSCRPNFVLWPGLPAPWTDECAASGFQVWEMDVKKNANAKKRELLLHKTVEYIKVAL